MSSEGTVYDLGYKPYDGENLGRAGSRRAIVWDGVRRVLGLRRRARTKILPWGLMTIALFPAIVFIGIGVIGGEAITDDFFSQSAQVFLEPDASSINSGFNRANGTLNDFADILVGQTA